MNGILKSTLKKLSSEGDGYGQWRDNLSEALQIINNRPITESLTPLMRMLTPNLVVSTLKMETIMYWKMHQDAQPPYRGSPAAAGLDLYALEAIVIAPGQVKMIPTGIGCKILEGHYGQLATRSSFALKGAVVIGGVIDSDYQGEIKILMINLGPNPLIIAKGERAAQMLLIPIYLLELREGEAPTELTVRGDKGFGSTNTVNVGAKIWVQNVQGPPSPAEVIAVGKDRTLLIMRPGVEKWEYVPQEKCYLRE
ncbi:deoxyuridine 5 -triphosphate nucleotidohydrolase-like [Pelobates cultripes]|uniref:Deoxyuridine 5'-triphosphate nucleotidohydrolase n=1 Tax=Pelobates cultripes TaxID=61616 RepID=A0AAD1VZ39_PELCU|nr:deoxyuridine 5 -triphosphate nucleotidohydrolase-like [Pelobates cultripes]